VTLYRKEDIVRNAPSVRMDPHSPALLESILTADLFGRSPTDVVLAGITGASYKARCELSIGVERGVEDAIAAVLNELDRFDVEYEQRRVPINVAVWWAKAVPAAPPLS
jgi:Hydrogenase maturation protease